MSDSFLHLTNDLFTDIEAQLIEAARLGHAPYGPLRHDGDPYTLRLTQATVEAPDCPECLAGKHRNCSGQTLAPTVDELVLCPCSIRSHEPKAG